MNKTVAEQKQTREDAAMFAGVGALVGAGLGACIGLLAADENLRRKIFSSYSDIKTKGIELYQDLEHIQRLRNKPGKVKFLKPSDE